MEKWAVVLCSEMHMDIDNANSLLAHIQQKGRYEIVCDYTVADAIIVITCAFGPGKMHSVRVIADVRKNCKPDTQVIVTGCLVKLYKDELKAIPGISVVEFQKLREVFDANTKKIDTTPLQNKVIISEGCLHRCSYCVYPLIFPKYRSKPMEDVLEEVKKLYETESIIYITGAQETADYGVDLYGKKCFATLLDKIVKEYPNVSYVIGWFHPQGLTDEVISVIKDNANIIEIMLHIQHVDKEILKQMNRTSFQRVDKKIRELKEVRPDIAISTEVIVGFPGETDEQFSSLVSYLSKGYFSDVGVASYEAVPGTKAAFLPNQVSDAVKLERLEYIRKNFSATCYPASTENGESVIEEYIKACTILSKLPKSILNDRQKYYQIAGVDTREKLENLEDIFSEVMELIRNARTPFDFEKNKKYLQYKYTPEARNFFHMIIQQSESKDAIKARAKRLLLEDNFEK